MAERARPGASGAAILGLLGVALAAGAATVAGTEAVRSLVWPCLFWIGLSVGSLGLMLVHRLTGGSWGDTLIQPLRAGAATLPLAALMPVPILFGLDAVYPWAGSGAQPVAGSWWLNPPFFIARTLGYVVVWLILAWRFGAWWAPDRTGPGQGSSAFGLLVVIVTTTLAAFDWVMSLDPLWYSAVLGLLTCISGAAAALALAVLWRLGIRHQPSPPPEQLHDLGNLLLTSVLLWSYLVVMQFLTVWIANLPDEIRWFVPRLATGWRWLGLAVFVLQLALALPLLLSRRAKRNRRTLALAASFVVSGQALYALWTTLPTLRPDALRIAAPDLVLFSGVGAIWLGWFQWRLRQLRPVAEGARAEE